MAHLHFTSWLRELAPDGPYETRGETVGAALQDVFSAQPQIRAYVLDERGALRKHVCVFADGTRLANGVALDHPLRPETKVYIMQALSGG